MNRNAFCIVLVSGLLVLPLGSAARAQGLRYDSMARLVSAPSEPPFFSQSAPDTSSPSEPVVRSAAAPPAPGSALGGPSAPMPYIAPPYVAAPPPAYGQPLGPPQPYDPSLNYWGALQAPSDQVGDVVSPMIYPPPQPYGTPAYRSGFKSGGIGRMFFGGNDAEAVASTTYSHELWRDWQDWAPPMADRTPCYGVYLWEAYELWRSLPDGTQRPNGNNGVNQGINFAAPVPYLDKFGIGFQLGASYGAFNFSPLQNQGFITTGFFRRADASRPVSFGLVYDWMIVDNFGAFNQSMTLGQWRAQIAYAFSARNEVGIMGSIRDNRVTKVIAGAPIEYRVMSQGSLFWHHKFGPGGADGWLWTGFPDFNRLNGEDDYETNIFGGKLNVPLCNRLSAFTSFQGFRPTGGASHKPLYDFVLGLNYFPSANARTRTVAGQSWMPYMPVANNASFLVDTDRTF